MSSRRSRITAAAALAVRSSILEPHRNCQDAPILNAAVIKLFCLVYKACELRVRPGGDSLKRAMACQSGLRHVAMAT